MALIVIVAAFLWGSHNHITGPDTRPLLSQSNNNQSEAPLDTLSSADIAANIARVASLPESVSVGNQADSFNAQIASATVDQTIIAKPQLVAGGAKSRKDIQTYVTKAGDTVSSLATQFGVTSDSIRWSNSLSGDTLSAGKSLLIPPINGIVYLVKSSDTVDSIATRYKADKNQLVAFNDIELSGLPVGQYILIPDGTQHATTATYGYSVSFTVYNFTPQWGSNGYAPGWCTWYVANRVHVPTNWGNAYTWAYYARLSGWTVTSVPIVGAIAQTSAGWGHVAYVEDVSPDGTLIKYSDMNGLCGFNCVGITKDWVPSTHFQNYIYQ